MNNKRIVGLLALLVLIAPMMLAAPAVASDTVQVDGQAVDGPDQTNTTVITQGDTGNITVQFTEDHSLSDGSNQIIAFLNESAANASLATSSGSGTASISLASNNTAVWANETGGGANAVTVTAFNVTWNTTTNGTDGINTSEAMSSEADLAQDDDETENHTYIVVDNFYDVSYAVNGPAGGEINTTSGDYEPNSTGEVQFVFELTRNETTYENYSLESNKFSVGLDTTYFSDITETTSEDVDRIVLENVQTQNVEKEFEWSIQPVNNTTNTYTVKVNATVESGEANGTLVHTETHDPIGGVEADHATSFGHAAGAGIVAPNFFESLGLDAPVAIAAILIGLLVIGGLYLLYRDRDPSKTMRGYAAYEGVIPAFGWALLLLVGFSMIWDYLADSILTIDFWSNILVANVGLPPWSTGVLGIIVVVVALGLNASNSDSQGFSLSSIRG